MNLVEEAKPSVMAFMQDTALPSGVRGPVDFLAFSRLAARCFSVAMRWLLLFREFLEGEFAGANGRNGAWQRRSYILPISCYSMGYGENRLSY
jgi:hypothetical protein